MPKIVLIVLIECFMFCSSYSQKNGEYKEYDENGNLIKIENYKNDKLNGEYKTFFSDGKLSSYGTYIDGKQDGEWKFYSDTTPFSGNWYEDYLQWTTIKWDLIGELAEIQNYKNDKKDGKWQLYYENGGLIYEKYYIDDSLIFPWKMYYRDGKLKCLNDSATKKWYYKSGHIKSIESFSHRYEKKEFYESGKLHSVFKLIDSASDNIGNYKEYYRNGHLKSSGALKMHGADITYFGRVGEWKSYHENGSLKSIEIYRHDYSADGEDGEWKSYYKSGKINSIIRYAEGKREGEWKAYYENGIIRGLGKFLHGVGEWKAFYENGKIYEIVKFEDDGDVGYYTVFSENGKIIAKGDDHFGTKGDDYFRMMDDEKDIFLLNNFPQRAFENCIINSLGAALENEDNIYGNDQYLHVKLGDIWPRLKTNHPKSDYSNFIFKKIREQTDDFNNIMFNKKYEIDLNYDDYLDTYDDIERVYDNEDCEIIFYNNYEYSISHSFHTGIVHARDDNYYFNMKKDQSLFKVSESGCSDGGYRRHCATTSLEIRNYKVVSEKFY